MQVLITIITIKQFIVIVHQKKNKPKVILIWLKTCCNKSWEEQRSISEWIKNQTFPKRRIHPWQQSLPAILHAPLVSYEVKMSACAVGFGLTSVCKWNETVQVYPGQSFLLVLFLLFSFSKTSFSRPIFLGDAPHLSTVTQCVSDPEPYMWWHLICARRGVPVRANMAAMSLFTNLPTPAAPEAWNCYSEEPHFICIQVSFQNNFYPSARNRPKNVNVSRVALPLQPPSLGHQYDYVLFYTYTNTSIIIHTVLWSSKMY